METKKLLLLGLLLTLGIFSTGQCKPKSGEEEGVEDDTYQDDQGDYGDYDDESAQDKSVPARPTDTNEISGPASFRERNITVKVRTDQTAILTCPVINLRSSNIIFWYNGTVLLTQSKVVFPQDSRISVDDNFSLHIKRVTAFDAHDYLCKVIPEQVKLIVSLKIDGPHKTARIMANNVDVTNQSVHYNPNHPGREFRGKSLEMFCMPEGGSPVGTIVWSHTRNDNDEPTRTIGSKLLIQEVNKKSSGLYQCLVDNKEGKPIHATVTVIAEHKPEFHKAESHVNTGIGYDADLHCIFEANPAPRHVHWYKDSGERIHENDKYKIYNDFDKKDRSRTSLQIKNVQQKDLIKYHCEVENTYGKNRSIVMLGLHPGTPHLESKSYNNGVLKTVWTVKSLQPVTELQVSYLENLNGAWEAQSALITEKDSPHNSKWRVESEIKLNPGEYQIRAKVKNTEGWSMVPSETHLIKADDSIVIAGTGGGGTSGVATVFRLSVLSVLFLTPTLLFI